MAVLEYPVAPFAVLELRSGRPPKSPRPPLAAVLIDVNDDRCELVVTIDGDGLMVARLYDHQLEASGCTIAVVERSGTGSATAIGTLSLLGYDMGSDRCVTGQAAIALSWSTDVDGLVTAGSALVTGVAGDQPLRFGAVNRHPFNECRLDPDFSPSPSRGRCSIRP